MTFKELQRGKFFSVIGDEDGTVFIKTEPIMTADIHICGNCIIISSKHKFIGMHCGEMGYISDTAEVEMLS